MVKTLFRFLQKRMLLIVLILIALGTLLGLKWHSAFVFLKPTLPLALFVMLYPMMIGVDIRRFKEIGKDPKDTLLALVLNQVIASLIIGPLVLLTIKGQPAFAAGMVLMGVGPGAGSAVAFTGIAGGEVAVVMTDVVVTMLVSIVAIPLWTLLWVGKMIPVPVWNIIKSILLYVVLPLIIGQITRLWILKRYGKEWFKEHKTYLQGTSLLGVYWMVLMVFGLEGGIILKNPVLAIQAIIVMLFFYLITFAIPIGLGKLLRMSYSKVVALTYGSASKNMTLSTALAIANFGAISAIGVAMGGPFTQMWLLIVLASLFPKWKSFFDIRR